MRELVRSIRAARAENNIPAGKRIKAIVVAGENAAALGDMQSALCALARLDADQLEIVDSAEAPDDAIVVSLGDYTCYLPLAGLVDKEKEIARLTKELADLTSQIERKQKLLNGPFAEKAPAAVVQRERDDVARMEASSAEISERLQALN